MPWEFRIGGHRC